LVDAQIQHRRPVSGGDVVGAGRLPSFQSVHAGRASQRPRCDRGLLGPSPCWWVLVSPGPTDASVGVVRDGQDLRIWAAPIMATTRR
jgi:hypothetical protein